MEQLNSLFTLVTRDERQQEAVDKWMKAKGRATIVGCTGFGKSYVAIKAIKRMRVRYPTLNVLILVPTTALKQQWVELLTEQGVIEHTSVRVMMGASQKEAKCDLLIIDEAHRVGAQTLSNVFNVIKYKAILGLTATFERLDGRDRILAQYAPVCDEIPIHVAMANGWVSKYKDYVVVLEVPDIDVYKTYNKDFQESLSFFDWDFNTALNLTSHDKIVKYTNSICTNKGEWKDVYKKVMLHHVKLMKTLHARKAFIANHPEKIRVAQKIIEKRKDKKIITFCPSVKIAESFKNGYVFTGRDGKKKNRITMEEFMQKETGILHTCRLAEEGVSVGDLSVGIMLNVNSSKTKQIQTLTAI